MARRRNARPQRRQARDPTPASAGGLGPTVRTRDELSPRLSRTDQAQARARPGPTSVFRHRGGHGLSLRVGRKALILVAYDGSPEARRALLHAADLVGAGGRLTVVNVISTQSVSARLETVSDQERERQERVLADARSLLSDRGVEMQAIAVAGDPATEIRALVEKSGADILVVGQAQGSRHLIHGSVSTRLVRRAPCDVLVVH